MITKAVLPFLYKVIKTADSAALKKSLEDAGIKASGPVDTRAETNLLRGNFLLQSGFLDYGKNLNESDNTTHAEGKTAAEISGLIAGGLAADIITKVMPGLPGGPAGIAISVIANFILSEIGSQKFGEFWDRFEDGSILKILDEWALANQNTSSIYPKTVQSLLGQGILHTDPLVIDLSGKGIRLTDVNSSKAMFDLTGSGFANKVGWITNDEGFLVLDKNNNGKVDDISEMFGNSSTSGFQSLSAYDANKDGKIDSSDPIFKDLKVWQDTNNDGITEPGELKSLSELGIKSISLNAQRTNITQNGNQITQIASVEKEDGTTLQAADVNLTLNKLYSYYNKDVQLNPDILGLPWIKGYGFMPDLPIAMSLDTTLLTW
ncbi:hypothetical protein Thena_0074 [Thermodesulfobium narugense DSM 14796]|uniref:Hemolysin-type calcium-binding region n=1 Tax=Thermodesulfobium narugense DSM 14796 TaxID=747365 RepID=M1E4R8_9BACT|nr:hypothetical protein [Thermodesulfobium narugense]AEE13726.1 hypothetical protein Thena_0074 [Thermodesulfobium narugense DSM 14796]